MLVAVVSARPSAVGAALQSASDVMRPAAVIEHVPVVTRT
jgi:hypothetical protein